VEMVGSPNTRSRAAHYVRMSTEHQQYSLLNARPKRLPNTIALIRPFGAQQAL